MSPGMESLIIRDFTDPACPFAFSAEPARLRLRWLYGGQIEWRPRMVVLSQSPDDYVERGFTPERQVDALEAIKAKYGMPIDTRRRPRMMATVHACRAPRGARGGGAGGGGGGGGRARRARGAAGAAARGGPRAPAPGGGGDE